MLETSANSHFEQNYQSHLKHLKLKGLQPKTIDAYSRAVRRVEDRFDKQIDCDVRRCGRNSGVFNAAMNQADCKSAA